MRKILFVAVIAAAACKNKEDKGAPSAPPAAPAAAPTAPPTAPAAAPTPTPEAAVVPDKQKAMDHLKQHVKFPATRAQLLGECAKTPEFTEAEKRWFSERIPEGTYGSPEEVAKAVGMK